MTLRSLVFLAAISYTLVIGGSLFGYRILVVFPALLESTIERHSNDIKAVYSAYSSEKLNLIRFNADWANWDEAYDYIESEKESFIQSNMSGSFLESGIDAIAFINNQGKLIYAAKKKDKAFTQVETLSQISPDLVIDPLLENGKQFGFIRIKENLGYFASSQIKNTDETLPSRGVLIFIKILSKDLLNRTNYITKAKLKHYDIEKIESLNLDTDPFIVDYGFKIEKVANKYYVWITNHINMPIGIIEVKYSKGDIPKLFDKITTFSFIGLLLLPIFITIAVWVIFLLPITTMFKQIKNMSSTGTINNLEINSYITELKTFKAAFNDLVIKIHNYQDKLESESQTDGLTNLYNRRHFDEFYDQSWRASTRNALPLAIIMMDIDHFKKYNDHYGHQKGDDALIAVANALQSHTRRAMDLLARYGGEEFVMICQPDSEAHLEILLADILTSVANLNIEHVHSSTGNTLTISCGACHILNPGAWMQPHKELALKMADQALYKAKNTGRNKYHISHLDDSSSK